MIFNGYDFNQFLRVNPTRKLAADVDTITKNVPGCDGEIFMRAQLKPLVIPVRVRLNIPSVDSRSVAFARRQITARLITPKPAMLILPDEPDLRYLAKLTNASELTNLWSTGSADIEFTAFDPVAYGHEHTAKLGSSTVISVGGTWQTKPTLDLTATTAGKVKILNSGTQEFVLLHANVATGAKIIIDMQAQTVRVNSNLAVVDVSSDFFALAPGQNDLRITGATGTAIWTERWI